MSRRVLYGMFAGLFLLTSSTFDTSHASAQDVDAEKAAARDYSVAFAFQKKKLYVPAAARWAKYIQAYPKDKRLASAHLNLGVCQFGQKAFDVAAKTFREVLQKYPQFQQRDRAQFNLGMSHYNIAIGFDAVAAKSQAAADQQKAATEFKKAAAEFALLPKQYAKSGSIADAIYYQAECLYLAGDKKAAIPVYQQVVAKFATSPFAADALYGLGTTQAELEQHVEAATSFQQFIAKFPKDERENECRLRHGMALYSQDKFADAEKLFAQAAAVKDSPYADFALLRQARSLQAQDKLPNAAAIYELLPTKFKTSPYTGAALLGAGKCRFRAKQFPQAQKSFQAIVIQKLPEAAEAAYLLGRTLIQLKKPAEAVPVLNAAIAAYATSEFLPDLTFTRIDALYEQPPQRPQTAKLYADFAQKYAKHTRAAEAMYRATFVAWEAEGYDAARQYAATFLANQEFVKHELKPEVIFLGAESQLLGKNADVAKAEALYRRLVAEHPKSNKVANAQVRIGYCLYSTKKYDPAIAFLTPSLAGLKDPAQLAEAQLLIGRSHSEAGRAKNSIPAFRAALAANPKWDRGDEVLYLLARSLRLEKADPAATVELNKLVGQFPKSTFLDRCYYQLGEIELAAKKYDTAVAQYRKVMATFPKSETAPLAQYGVGLSFFQKADWKTATTEFATLVTKYPQHEVVASGLYLRGRSYYQLADYPKAVADLTKYLASKPTTPDAFTARHTLGKCQAALKQFVPAAATYVALLKEKPDYPQADSLHYDLAFAYLDGKQEKQAADTFLALVTKHPTSPLVAESWFRVGEFQENSEQPAEAIKAFTAGLKSAKKPDLREKLYHKLGWVQYQQSQFAAAATAFQEQVKQFPKGELLMPGRFLAGESLYKQAKFDQALPMYAAVIAAKAPKFHANALYRCGDCAAGLKQWKQSETSYIALIGAFPKFPNINEARYGLGLAYQNQNQFAPAKKAFAEVVKATTSPTAAKSKYMMGECAFAEKKYKEAYEHFLEAAAGYPDKGDYREWLSKSHFEAARCFIQLKQVDLAKQELKAVIEKYADFPEAKNAQTLLTNLK